MPQPEPSSPVSTPPLPYPPGRPPSPRVKPAIHFARVVANILCDIPCSTPLRHPGIYSEGITSNVTEYGDHFIQSYLESAYGDVLKKEDIFKKQLPPVVKHINAGVLEFRGICQTIAKLANKECDLSKGKCGDGIHSIGDGQRQRPGGRMSRQLGAGVYKFPDIDNMSRTARERYGDEGPRRSVSRGGGNIFDKGLQGSRGRMSPLSAEEKIRKQPDQDGYIGRNSDVGKSGRRIPEEVNGLGRKTGGTDYQDKSGNENGLGPTSRSRGSKEKSQGMTKEGMSRQQDASLDTRGPIREDSGFSYTSNDPNADDQYKAEHGYQSDEGISAGSNQEPQGKTEGRRRRQPQQRNYSIYSVGPSPSTAEDGPIHRASRIDNKDIQRYGNGEKTRGSNMNLVNQKMAERPQGVAEQRMPKQGDQNTSDNIRGREGTMIGQGYQTPSSYDQAKGKGGYGYEEGSRGGKQITPAPAGMRRQQSPGFNTASDTGQRKGNPFGYEGSKTNYQDKGGFGNRYNDKTPDETTQTMAWDRMPKQRDKGVYTSGNMGDGGYKTLRSDYQDKNGSGTGVGRQQGREQKRKLGGFEGSRAHYQARGGYGQDFEERIPSTTAGLQKLRQQNDQGVYTDGQRNGEASYRTREPTGNTRGYDGSKTDYHDKGEMGYGGRTRGGNEASLRAEQGQYSKQDQGIYTSRSNLQRDGRQMGRGYRDVGTEYPDKSRSAYNEGPRNTTERAGNGYGQDASRAASRLYHDKNGQAQFKGYNEGPGRSNRQMLTNGNGRGLQSTTGGPRNLFGYNGGSKANYQVTGAYGTDGKMSTMAQGMRTPRSQHEQDIYKPRSIYPRTNKEDANNGRGYNTPRGEARDKGAPGFREGVRSREIEQRLTEGMGKRQSRRNSRGYGGRASGSYGSWGRGRPGSNGSSRNGQDQYTAWDRPQFSQRQRDITRQIQSSRTEMRSQYRRPRSSWNWKQQQSNNFRGMDPNALNMVVYAGPNKTMPNMSNQLGVWSTSTLQMPLVDVRHSHWLNKAKSVMPIKSHFEWTNSPSSRSIARSKQQLSSAKAVADNSAQFQRTGSESDDTIKSILQKSFPCATEIVVEDISGGMGTMYNVFIEDQEFECLSSLMKQEVINDAVQSKLRYVKDIRIQTLSRNV